MLGIGPGLELGWVHTETSPSPGTHVWVIVNTSYHEMRAVFVYSSSFHHENSKTDARKFWRQKLRHYYGERNVHVT